MTTNMTRTGLFETPRGQSKPEPGLSSRSSASDPPRAKLVTTTPKFRRIARSTSKVEFDSTSRVLADQSPGSAALADQSLQSVPSAERLPTPVDSKTTNGRISKKSDLQAELNSAKEELKEANEHLVYLEKEKNQALEKLQEAKRQVDKAYEQLAVAISAKKEAEEKIEIEKFRIVELEQAGIEAAQQREEAWQKEIDSIRKQHSLDVSALLAATQELENVKQELAMTLEAKNVAANHADDALKIAEVHAEKASFLSTEVNRLKALLDSKLENAAKETAEHARRLELEIVALQDELRRAKESEKKLSEMDVIVKGLRGQITNARKSKSDADALVIEWKKEAELLEAKVNEAIQSEKSALKSLALTAKQLEDRDASLKEAGSEIVCLKNKVELLESEIVSHKEVLGQSNHQLELARSEIVELEKTIPSLKFKIQIVEEEKNRALEHKEQMASSIPAIVEKNNKLEVELEASKNDLENAKKAMEGLVSALQEVKAEAKESKEQLKTKQAEVAEAQCQIDELDKALKTNEEKYKMVLFDAQNEVARLKSAVEKFGMDAKNIELERNLKEENYISSIKRSEEEIIAIKTEMDKLVDKLNASRTEAATAVEERAELQNRLEQAMKEAKSATEAVEGARDESLKLKERLLDKENELQSIAQENDDLRIREEEANKMIIELSIKLEEAQSKKAKENGIVSTSNGEHDVAAKMPRFPDEVEVVNKASMSGFHVEGNEVFDEEGSNKNELVRNGSQQDSNTELEDGDEGGDDLAKVSTLSPEKETVPSPLDARLNLIDENLDNRIEELSPSREHREKKKKFFKLGSLLKKKTHPK